MAEMFKFFYTVIILVSLFLVVAFSNGKLIQFFSFVNLKGNLSSHLRNVSFVLFYIIEECTSAADCYKIYPHLSLLPNRCFEGICYFTFDLPGKKYLFIMFKLFIFFYL